MAKSRGLPDNFKLNVAPSITKPVELADYLDDEMPQPWREKVPPPIAAAPSIVVEAEEKPAPAAIVAKTVQQEAPAIIPQEKTVISPSEPALFPDRPVRPPVPARPTRLKTTVPRKQINMSSETLMMVDALEDHFKTYSVQKDLSAAELFHALVLALFEAREELDLSRVQPRGRWGTPTAAALPIALKNAMQKAIQRYSEMQK